MIMKKQIILTILSCLGSLTMAANISADMSSTSVYIKPNKAYSGLNKHNYIIPEHNNAPVFNYNYSPSRVSKGKVNSYGGRNENAWFYPRINITIYNSPHDKALASSGKVSYILPAKSTYSSVIHPIFADNANGSEGNVNIRRVNPFTPPADPFLPIGDVPLWFAIPFTIIAYLFIHKSNIKKESA